MTVINFKPPKKSAPPPASWSEFGRLLSSIKSCTPSSEDERLSLPTIEVMLRSMAEASAMLTVLCGRDGGRIA